MGLYVYLLELTVLEILEPPLQSYISHLGKYASYSGFWVLIRFDRKYLVSAPINTYYYTQMIGDAKQPPTLLAASNFKGFAVIGKIQSTSLNPFSFIFRRGPIHGWWCAVVHQPEQLVRIGFLSTSDRNECPNTYSYRSVRNLIIDLRKMPASAPAIGLHWQVSQSTSLINVVVEMSKENGTQHQGLIFLRSGII